MTEYPTSLFDNHLDRANLNRTKILESEKLKQLAPNNRKAEAINKLR